VCRATYFHSLTDKLFFLGFSLTLWKPHMYLKMAGHQCVTSQWTFWSESVFWKGNELSALCSSASYPIFVEIHVWWRWSPCACYEGIWWGGGAEVLFHSFLMLALDGCEWSASCSGHFTDKGKKPSVHWIRGWVALEPVWTFWKRENFFCPCRESNSGLYSLQSSDCTDCVTAAYS
jgi:hypothetical protein